MIKRTCETCALWQGGNGSYLGVCGLPTSAAARTEFDASCGAHTFKSSVFTIEMDARKPDTQGEEISFNSTWQPWFNSWKNVTMDHIDFSNGSDFTATFMAYVTKERQHNYPLLFGVGDNFGLNGFDISLTVVGSSLRRSQFGSDFYSITNLGIPRALVVNTAYTENLVDRQEEASISTDDGPDGVSPSNDFNFYEEPDL